MPRFKAGATPVAVIDAWRAHLLEKAQRRDAEFRALKPGDWAADKLIAHGNPGAKRIEELQSGGTVEVRGFEIPRDLEVPSRLGSFWLHPDGTLEPIVGTRLNNDKM